MILSAWIIKNALRKRVLIGLKVKFWSALTAMLPITRTAGQKQTNVWFAR